MNPIDILIQGSLPSSLMSQIDAGFRSHHPRSAEERERILGEVGPRVRAVVTNSHQVIDGKLIDRLPNLEIIASFGVGYDRIDLAHAARRHVVVTNTPDVLTDEVADLAVALLLATIRQLPQAEAYLRAGLWEKPFLFVWRSKGRYGGIVPLSRGFLAAARRLKKVGVAIPHHQPKAYPLTASLRGRRIGILGFGRIGRAIATRLSGFGVEIAYHSRNPRENLSYRYYPDLMDMARAVDVLIVAVPGGATTRYLVDADVLRALGPNGVLVNVARGSVVDERALIEALRSRTIMAAGLDVYENEPVVPKSLIELDNVVLLPHVGSASVHTREAMSELVLANLRSWFDGQGPLSPVAES